MTLNRTLLTITILILGTLAFLSFAPPQTGKWVYIFQRYYLPESSDKKSYFGRGTMPEGYQGIWTHWYKNGNIQSRTNIDKGLADGVSHSYFESGQLQFEFNIAMGKRSGEQKEWYESGQLKSLIVYKDDEMNGSSMGWYEDGVKKFVAGYNKGERQGLLNYWDDKGNLLSECNYRNGKLIGKEYRWDSVGNLIFIQIGDGKSTPKVIFDLSKSIDRRKEFGIEVE